MSLKKIIRRSVNRFGFEIRRIKKPPPASEKNFQSVLKRLEIDDVSDLAKLAESIPGMTSLQSCQFLYTLCYMQELKGDVVEIGSWQGRSTSMLARAVINSRNGKLYAIDHFRGNVGKEDRYRINDPDLSDLKSGFESNMRRLGLSEHVNLLDMPNDAAERILSDIEIRFLFIDGDHTKQGVEKDIRLFFPKLVKGSIVVFDDFSGFFPGLVEALEDLLSKNQFRRIMAYPNTLVLKILE